jgi:large subunit ribosomal protein L1
MGKKKLAVLDLADSDSPKLKASGVRSQKLTKSKKKDDSAPTAIPVKEVDEVPQSGSELPASAASKEASSEPKKKRVKHDRSKRYLKLKKLVDSAKVYPIDQAIKLLRELSSTKFDASVELHCNLNVDKLSGELNLPHGTGKTIKIEIASDKTLVKLKNGQIDFEVLISEPQMMPKLAQYAKLLGPKGLMPNPKTGTISDKPEEVKKKMAGGSLRYKSEPKAPILHLVIGKLSFKDSQLNDHIKLVIKELKLKNLKSVFLCSSMSPSIKLSI